ncbi:mitochondrial inner membrane protein OXA1L-like [Belonocnema kinseyi]|uniref:mitochondrial inner membrane protein OXA1L-like n=1 Tax=Belonocnema kinseyi TaxID=2817044 RepID=UPI00143CCF47|nr:mitochondrial inner membrane protein OXA1L-like [Belonocnema kinseyi]
MLSRMSLTTLSRAVPKSHSLTKNRSSKRSLHLICRNRIITVSHVSNSKIVLGQSFNRHASTVDTFQIPAPPIAPTIINEPQVITENISELANAGLGTSWTPVSLVQHILEFLHASVGLPWWGSIIAVTVVARIVCFPLIIKAQRNMAEMATYMPEFQAMNKKMASARLAGDRLAVEELSKEMSILLKGREFDSLKSLFPALLQGSIAISIFLSLDRMTRAPLPSMREGGLSWFTDLCVPDPYYLLPVTSSTTLMLLLFGSSKMLPISESTKKAMIVIVPSLTFFFVKGFPAGTLVYWVTTNSITLLQHQVLKLPAVKKYYGLPEVAPPKNPVSGKMPGFLQSFQENMQNVKVAQKMNERFSLRDLEKRRAEIIDSKEAFKDKKR